LLNTGSILLTRITPSLNHERILIGLRKLSTVKPTTKMGQVRWAWREIQAALAVGHSLQFVHQRLNDAGIEIGYRTLSLYIGRLEREQGLRRPYATTAAQQAKNVESSSPAGPRVETVPVRAAGKGEDPFSNIRREREKKRSSGFEYDAFSMNKNLLE
jgi:hypothetical protein